MYGQSYYTVHPRRLPNAFLTPTYPYIILLLLLFNTSSDFNSYKTRRTNFAFFSFFYLSGQTILLLSFFFLHEPDRSMSFARIIIIIIIIAATAVWADMFLRRPYNIDTAYIGIIIPVLRRDVAAAQRKFPFSLSYFNISI